MVTWLSSPITSTWDRTNCIMHITDFGSWTFNFAQNVLHKILDEAPESIKQLCNFLLKSSKVRRNGGVLDFDLPPIKEISVGSTLFDTLVEGLPISWVYCEITTVGRGAIGTAFSSFKSNFCWCFNLLSSWEVILCEPWRNSSQSYEWEDWWNGYAESKRRNSELKPDCSAWFGRNDTHFPRPCSWAANSGFLWQYESKSLLPEEGKSYAVEDEKLHYGLCKPLPWAWWRILD